MVMPANSTRDELESATTKADQDVLWDIAGQEILPPSIDAGAIQFLNGRIRFGQLSRLLTDAYAAIAPSQSEADIRASVGKILPKIAELKGVWRNCLVAFSCDNLPLVGSLDGYENLHLFSGFTSPTVYVPTLSKRFAAYARGQSDTIIPLLSPQRFV
jgi:glycine/D-amino acid oxidase-like deaminating enzyme